MEEQIRSAGCVHALPGRLRVRLSSIKKAPAIAVQVEEALRRERGIEDVIANPVTGSVLVRYDTRCLAPQAILTLLEPFGFSPALTSGPTLLQELSSELTRTIGMELVKMALVEMLPFGPVELICALI